MLQACEGILKDLIALADGGRLGSAYLFYGPPKAGKLAAAKALAAYLESGAAPAATAAAGKEAAAPGRALTDTRVFAPDEKGSIGIDAARTVKAYLSEKPFIGVRRTAIVDRAQALTPEAQNAFLKVAEEPPAAALLILVLPDPELLRPTLQSRFQKIYFPPLPEKAMRQALAAETDPLAARFFTVPPASRKDFVKELTEPEDFNFTAFLDALIAHLAARPQPPDGKLWHAVLELRRMQDATNLSPRLQLMNLWTLT